MLRKHFAMKSSLIAGAAFLASAEAVTIDWGKALATIPASMRSNVTSPLRKPSFGAVTSCGTASSHAKNFVYSIVPDAPKANQDVVTTFDYVRAARRGAARGRARGAGAARMRARKRAPHL